MGHLSYFRFIITNFRRLAFASHSVNLGRSIPLTFHHNSMYYSDYLQLEKILKAQNLASKKGKCIAHEEMLFIITHQTYELWFKQILFELDAVIIDFQHNFIFEDKMLTVLTRLQRIETIFDLLIQQFKIIETMSPMDFIEFRDLLIPASGFQSLQFRMLSVRMGIEKEVSKKFYSQLSKKDSTALSKIKSKISLFDVFDKWMSQIYFSLFMDKNLNFWQEYLSAVEQVMQSRRIIIKDSYILSEINKRDQLEQLDTDEQYIRETVTQDFYQNKIDNKERRLSYQAMMSALCIVLYRERAVLHMPYQILSTLINIDALLNKWLLQHIALVIKNIGNKVGTGGSSGVMYLSNSVYKHRIFKDLMDIPNLIICRSVLPDLHTENILKSDL